MARITKIKSQKNKKRVNIYLDGKFAFPLDADNFLKAGLKVDQVLSEKEVEDLIFKNEFQKLLDKVHRLLSFRPRSEKEIHDYLKKKIWKLEFGTWKFHKGKFDIKKKLIDKIIKTLKKQKLTDDYAFVAWWIEQRLTFRPRGKLALRVELAQKGIKRDLAEKMIDQMVNELPLAKKAAQRKMKTYKRLDNREFCEKMTAFLSRRGFSWETIKTIIDQLKHD